MANREGRGWCFDSESVRLTAEIWGRSQAARQRNAKAQQFMAHGDAVAVENDGVIALCWQDM